MRVNHLRLRLAVVLFLVCGSLSAVAMPSGGPLTQDPNAPTGTFVSCTRVDGCYACDDRDRCVFIPYMSGGGCACKNIPVKGAGPGITYCQKYGQCTYTR